MPARARGADAAAAATAGAGGDHGRTVGSAISVTRYGDEAYDFRDVRALARFGVNPGADGGWPQFLGAGMLGPECHQDNPPVRKFCRLCGVSGPLSWPWPPRPAWRPSVLVRQWAGQSRTSMFWAACCRYWWRGGKLGDDCECAAGHPARRSIPGL